MRPACDIVFSSMDYLIQGKTKGRVSPPAAFILYRPQTKGGKELLFYNWEAWRILCRSAVSQGGEEDPTPDVSALCRKWKEIFDSGLRSAGGPGDRSAPETGIIDLFQSGKRQYAVKGAFLSDTFSSQEGRHQYLFILERSTPEKMNFPKVFRNMGLSHREQEIVRLLLAGLSNKEIADSLNLSLNTVKGYMKLLTRKLGTNSRTGIVASIFKDNALEKS